MVNQISVFLYVRLEKGIYGLVQAGTIAYAALKEYLCPFGYEPAPITLRIWIHNENKIKFTLAVNSFGIRYHIREDSQKLINALQ